MKMYKIPILLMTLLLLIASCSSESAPVVVAETPPVVGIWDLVELNINPPQDINGNGNTTTNILTELSCVSGVLTIRADNSWDLILNGVIITAITGDLFNIECANFTSSSAGTWSFQNNQLTLFQGVTPTFYTLSADNLTNIFGEDLPQFSSEVYQKR